MSTVNTQMFLNSAARALATEAIAKIQKIDTTKTRSFTVVSFSDERTTYKVTLRKRKVADTVGLFISGCDCPHYQFRRYPCKHMISVSLEEQLPLLALERERIEHINKEYRLKLKQQQTSVV